MNKQTYGATTVTTTEFYRKPYESMKKVFEGKTIYVKYKNIETPIAVLKPFRDEKAQITSRRKKIDDALKKYGFTGGPYKSGLDMQHDIRQ